MLATEVEQQEVENTNTESSKKTIKEVAESWLESESPYENESGRALLHFFAALKFGNVVVLEWLTRKGTIYHQASDIILDYISKNWAVQ